MTPTNLTIVTCAIITILSFFAEGAFLVALIKHRDGKGGDPDVW